MPYRLYLVTSNPKLSIKVIRNIYTEVYRTTKNLIFFECSIADEIYPGRLFRLRSHKDQQWEVLRSQMSYFYGVGWQVVGNGMSSLHNF